MIGKFFNSLYYGKAGKGDYTPENLPKNRMQLFFEVLRVRWSAMIRLNLLYVLFWLPALVWSVWNYMALDAVLASHIAGEMTEAVFNEQIIGLCTMWLLVLWPCIAITGPATAGVTYVSRNWARDQHSFMFSDFKDAFKSNWKQALLTSTITGLLPLVVFVCYRFYGSMASAGSAFFILPQVLVVMLGVMWLLSLQVVYSLMVTYDLPFGGLIRNALILSVGRLPQSIGIRLLSLLVPAIAFALLMLAPSITAYVLLVVVLYYLLFGFAFNRLLYASFANAVTEKYINTHIDGAPVNVGLRQLTDDDYEIDPTLPQPRAEDESGADEQ